VGYWVNSTLH